jgi:type II secretory pathway pseudopilin PulG
MVEVLTVCGIIAIVAGITFPVVGIATRAAQISKTTSNLHQLHVAIKLYQLDWDGDGRYGDISEMGLPSIVQIMKLGSLHVPEEVERSGCPVHPSRPPGADFIDYWPGGNGTDFSVMAQVFRENIIIFSDMNCTSADVPLDNVYQSRRGLGVLLSGQLLNKFKTGNAGRPGWWSDPQP